MSLGRTTDRPEAYLAGDRRRALAEGRDLPDRVRGAGLFADISGFTPLTEALVAELGPQRGAEALSAILEDVFDALLGELHRHGGAAIYFSGDAVTCWLDGDDGTTALACGLAMQRQMALVGRPALPGGKQVRLELKVAVAAGPARRFVVGDPAVQLIDVLAGQLVDDLAAAEQHAERGEVVIDPATQAALGPVVELSATRDGFGVVAGLRADPQLPPRTGAPPDLPEEISRQWLLPVVYERLRTGRGEFLAELRTAVPLFLRFGGIDFDRDDNAHVVLDEFVVATQRIVDGYGGNVLQLTLGDKGAYLYAVFGSPVAHEDDPARACAAALELVALADRSPVRDVRIGVSRGRVRSGTYGHAHRRTFCCLGDPVNLAARLMSQAPDGGVCVSDAVHDAAGGHFEWGEPATVAVKGKSGGQRVVPLLGLRSGRAAHRRHALPLVGRESELRRIEQAVETVRGGRGQLVVVTAEAGLGKSRLLAEAGARIRAAGLRGAEGEASAFGARIAYAAWRPVWTSLLGLDADPADPADPAGDAGRDAGRDTDRDADPDHRRAALRSAVAAADPALVERLPLLGPLLGLELDETALTRDLDAKLRKASLEQTLARLLPREPTAILLEDAHWLDLPSQDLLLVLARALAARPVLLLVATRDDGADWLAAARGLASTVVLELDALGPDAAAAMLGEKALRLFGLAAPPEPLLEFVLGRSEGNPFHIEELLNFVHSRGVDPADRRALAALDVPDSLHTLVLSRLDQLAEPPRRTVKVASVVGRLFETDTLTGSYPDLGEVSGELATLRDADLVLLESERPEAHLFRHTVIRDVAYDSLTFGQRELLHERIGGYLETRGTPLGVLAYHFARSANVPKKRDYLVRAGEAALAAYDNATAADYLGQAVPLLELPERGPVRRRLGSALELLGQRAEAEAVYRAWLDEAGDDPVAAAPARLALGEVARKQGRYGEAEELMRSAQDDLVRAGDEAGQGEALHLAGTLAAQQGRYDDARELYSRSLVIRRRLGDRAREAALLGNLGIVAEYEGDYDTARALNEQALALRTELDDRWAVGASLINVGMVAGLQDDLTAAAASFTESLAIMQQIGDPWMTAIVQNNLGTTLRRMARHAEAATLFRPALHAYVQFDDRWALAHLYEDVAELAAALGPAGAGPTVALMAVAGALRDEIGAARPPARQAEVDALLAGLPDDRPPGVAVDDGVAVAEGVFVLATGQDR